MSGVLFADRYLTPMTEADLDEVAAVEKLAYEFPWSRGNFQDSLRNGYCGVCLRHVTGTLLGYCVLMPVVDEMHLLNLCVAPSAQRAGAGLTLLREAVRIARSEKLEGILLEVRPSNPRAIQLYERFGFSAIGRRKNYYPARHRSREDAIVMRLSFMKESTRMALNESLVEELGFGPVWVRRGVRVAEAKVEAVAATVADRIDSPATAPDTSTRVEREPAPAPAPAHVEARGEPSADHDAPSLDAYDDLPWTDDEPAHAPPVVAEAEPNNVRTLDWDALAARVAGCDACRLCERRTNTVFGVGDREADWMLIGEAPGENEDKQGEPFVGQAGKLLDNMLRALTLSRDSNVYIANVIKCRPPGNRNPELDEVARCEPYLQRQVELVKPKVIVALGRFAAQSLLKTESSIASMRGRVHEYQGVSVVVTYHPAYLLRSLADKSKAWADLCLARSAYRAALEKLGVEPSGESRDPAARKGAR